MKNNKVLVILLFLFTSLLSLGQLQRLQITDSIAFYLHDLFILQVVTIALVASESYRNALKEFILKRSLVEKLFLGVVAIGLGISFVTGYASLNSLMYLGRLGVYGVFGHLLFFLMQKKLLKQSQISLAFLTSGVLIAFFGLLQYIFLPDTRFLFFLGWDDHYYRVISTLLDPGFTGIMLIMTLWLFQSFSPHIKLRYRTLATFIFHSVVIITLLLTYSRASYVAFGITVALYILFQVIAKRFKVALLWLGIALLFVTAIPFLPRPGGEGVKLARTASTVARISATQEYLLSMRRYEWVFGKGLFVSSRIKVDADGYRFPDHAQIADSWPVFILSGTGIIGLGLFLLLLIQKLIFLFKTNKELFLIAVAILIHGLFNATIVYPFVVLFFLGSAVALITQKTSR